MLLVDVNDPFHRKFYIRKEFFYRKNFFRVDRTYVWNFTFCYSSYKRTFLKMITFTLIINLYKKKSNVLYFDLKDSTRSFQSFGSFRV